MFFIVKVLICLMFFGVRLEAQDEAEGLVRLWALISMISQSIIRNGKVRI